MNTGYTLNMEELCQFQSFTPELVVSAELVFPKGAVPNSQILWVRVELVSGDRKFVTLPLSEFYRFVDLPESSIGGWTDGNRGSDHSGLNARYENHDTGSDEPLSGNVLDSPEGLEESVASGVLGSEEGGQSTGV